jgi:hypothetical protein
MNLNSIINEEIINFLNENMSYDDWETEHVDMARDIFLMLQNKQHIKFNVIPKNQYHKALQEFVKYKEFLRFPTSKIFQWKDLILINISKLSALTEIMGHSSHFPFDEFYDVFDYNEDTGDDNDGEFNRWCKEKYEETGNDDYLKKYNFGTAIEFLDDVKNIDDYFPLFSNGQWVVSDYGVEPLEKLGVEIANNSSATELIVLINKVLDVTHQRSDLAELFIEGGSKSLDYISNY